MDSTGCIAFDSLTIFVDLKRPVYIPNAFSPNSDGFNDFFTAYTGRAGRIIKRLRVFDRWGEMVFDGFDLTPGVELEGWDGTFKGKPMDSAVFAIMHRSNLLTG
ncbi:MAG: gliding motility-associated C-terminal domain-containing protein [Saprospiraceae bacterium]